MAKRGARPVGDRGAAEAPRGAAPPVHAPLVHAPLVHAPLVAPSAGTGAAPRRRLADVLRAAAEDDGRDTVTVAELLRRLGPRGRAALILLFALPNAVPSPPGLSVVLGVPLLCLAAQAVLGREPWAPRAVGARAVSRGALARIVGRLAPWLARAERVLRPRWTWLVGRRGERWLGGLTLLLTVVMMVPLPLTNVLPAVAICVIALALLERDGLWAALGVALGAAALAVSGAVAYAAGRLAMLVLAGGPP